MLCICVFRSLAQNCKSFVFRSLSSLSSASVPLLILVVMDAFLKGAARGGITLCQNLINASVDQESVEDQFKQPEAQSGKCLRFWKIEKAMWQMQQSVQVRVSLQEADNSFKWFSVVAVSIVLDSFCFLS